ncbi:MAG: hypothetical protein LBJ95_04140 [Oscillospiraceae bacterium]|nr:hypothetical protein [Oscillospiraceae bacterium]
MSSNRPEEPIMTLAKKYRQRMPVCKHPALKNKTHQALKGRMNNNEHTKT